VINLADSGDEIVLLDGVDTVVDAVVYQNGSFPGVVPHPGVSPNHSLERWPPERDTNNCALDFIERLIPTPGS
jgi:hypothetical protein